MWFQSFFNNLPLSIHMDPSVTVLAVGMIVVFLAGLIQGTTGFGFAMIFMPVMLLLVEPEELVPISLILGTLVTAQIVVESRQRIQIERIWPLIVASLAGIPLGVVLLKTFGVGMLKVMIGTLVILFGILFLVGFSRRVQNERAALVPVGFAGGFLAGSISISGPPVIFFLANQGDDKLIFRANLALFLMTVSLVSVMYFGALGDLSRNMIGYASVFTPGLFAGGCAGSRMAHKVKEDVFRKLVLVVVTVSGGVAVISGMGWI